MKNWAKALIIIAVLSSSTIALLLAPLVPVVSAGEEIIPFNAGINQINLVADIEKSNIEIQYASSPTADLINVTWDLTVRHSILVPPPTVVVSWVNYTVGTELNGNLTIDFYQMQLASGLLCNVIITLNPQLISNFSITTTTGNINLTTTNFLDLRFLDVNLTCETGSIAADFIDGSDIQGDLRVQTTVGYSKVYVDTNSDIDGVLSAITTMGINNVTIRENITLQNDFIIQATTGNINFIIENISSLSALEITGVLETSTGAISATVTQFYHPDGNLTLDVDCDTGNILLKIDFNTTSQFSSELVQTTSGTETSSPLSGYSYSSGTTTYTSTDNNQSYRIDADLTTSSGNIVIQGGYT